MKQNENRRIELINSSPIVVLLPASNSSKGPLIFACFPSSSSTRLYFIYIYINQLRQPILSSKGLIISTLPELVSRSNLVPSCTFFHFAELGFAVKSILYCHLCIFLFDCLCLSLQDLLAGLQSVGVPEGFQGSSDRGYCRLYHTLFPQDKETS
ncbi:hypothetical protein ACN38_g3600 [Penicillium nordicum]|uniref:Uncharacterized protein n=1 Tax=Penicillium nordicum TaxID=229535 RepID=A0A0M8P5C3_9EURO|nr:hypothetical protein ACN38_g3600 [Penicillium nordicum]